MTQEANKKKRKIEIGRLKCRVNGTCFIVLRSLEYFDFDFLNVLMDVHNLKQIRNDSESSSGEGVMSEDEDLGNTVSGGSNVRSGDYARRSVRNIGKEKRRTLNWG